MKVKLGDLIVNYDRKRVPLSSRQRATRQGFYPYYGATSIMDYVDDYLFDGKYILLGEDGTVIDENGKPILQIAEGKFWCNNHAHILKNTNLVTFDYLYYLLKNTNVNSIVTGAVQPKISQSNLNGLEVEIYPEKEVQRKIASILLALDNKIRCNIELNNNLSPHPCESKDSGNSHVVLCRKRTIACFRTKRHSTVAIVSEPRSGFELMAA